DQAEHRYTPHRVPEVPHTAGRPVLGRIPRVEQDENGGDDQARSDRQQPGCDDESTPLAQLEDLGAHEARTVEWDRRGEGGHAAASRRDVISRNRRSSVIRSGSRRWTSIPASTRRRLMDAVVVLSLLQTRIPPSTDSTSSPASNVSARRSSVVETRTVDASPVSSS